MKGLSDWQHNKNGWQNRIDHVREVALGLTDGNSIPATINTHDAGIPKAKPDDIKLAPIVIKPESIAAFTGAVNAFGGMAAGSGPIQWAFAAGVALSFAVGAYYLINRIKQSEI